jgi:glycosyltransferase involved in cell wall biosynthesis
MTISISVVVPCYNCAAFVGEAVESALGQTLPPAEVIVLDDGSTDGSVQALARFGDAVRFVRDGSNRGAGHRRNEGAAMAKGDHIALLDADDVWRPGHLAGAAALLGAHPACGLAFSRVEFFGAGAGVWPHEGACPWGEPFEGLVRTLRNHFVFPSTMVVRKDLYTGVGGFDVNEPKFGDRRLLANDIDFVLRLARATRFVGSREPAVRYRIHRGQATVNRIAQALAGFSYRLKALDGLEREGADEELRRAAKNAVLLCWSEELEREWSERNTAAVRKMVRFGMAAPLLRDRTRPYLWKRSVPSSLLHWLDARRGIKAPAAPMFPWR